MDLIHLALTSEMDFYMKHDIRLRVIGRRAELSDRLVKAIDEAGSQDGWQHRRPSQPMHQLRRTSGDCRGG